MSEAGKLFRGEGYYAMRDKEGNYPLGITSNKDKMDDLNFYLDSLKDKEKQKDTSKKGEK